MLIGVVCALTAVIVAFDSSSQILPCCRCSIVMGWIVMLWLGTGAEDT